MNRFFYRVKLETVITADTMEEALDKFADYFGIPETGNLEAECIGEREDEE